MLNEFSFAREIVLSYVEIECVPSIDNADRVIRYVLLPSALACSVMFISENTILL